jgi:protein transport protein SEC31
MKRKLDDVARRLESLYDLLREKRVSLGNVLDFIQVFNFIFNQQLSQSSTESLNQLVQYVQIGDYMNGLGLHTQMVSGPEFSKIASFMPGIKSLLQMALQLQVYLR